jgi:hypothetical protein
VLKSAIAMVLAGLFVTTVISSAHAWDGFGHMLVAYVAYDELKPATKARVNSLIRLNPKYQTWVTWLPPGASQSQKNAMIFMIAATWADQIKSEPGYKTDGDHGGNRPNGSPDPSGNHGYTDKLMHKYWHFVDTPFTQDQTSPLPDVPVPNALERIALFRRVLASSARDALKSYDLVWLLHLVGDVHQPLHCATRVSAVARAGDDGGNEVKLACPECPPNLHAFWDDLVGTAKTIPEAIKSVSDAARTLPKATQGMAAKLDSADWIEESFRAAQDTAYRSPIGHDNGPFSLTEAYQRDAEAVALARVALAGARLAGVLNLELK